MACPVCGEALVVLELEGVEVDHCVECGGTWLDRGELELITGQAGVSTGRITEALERAGDGRRTDRRCPRCGRKMQEITVGEERAVQLDRCPRGDGLWLDRGELKAVTAAFHEGEEGSVARFFAELYSSELETQSEQKQGG